MAHQELSAEDLLIQLHQDAEYDDGEAAEAGEPEDGEDAETAEPEDGEEGSYDKRAEHADRLRAERSYRIRVSEKCLTEIERAARLAEEVRNFRPTWKYSNATVIRTNATVLNERIKAHGKHPHRQHRRLIE